MSWKNGILFAVGAFLVAGALLLVNRESVQGQGKGGGGGGGGGGVAKYTVVATDGSHIIVTDNSSSTLYFYAIDKDGKIGDDLKLRGKVNLKEVGQPSISPINAKPQK